MSTKARKSRAARKAPEALGSRRAKASRATLRSPAEQPSVRDVRKKLGMTRKAFSRLTGYSERTIANWESGQPLGGTRLQRIAEIQRLQKALARVIRAEYIGEWLQRPNQGFAGLKPLEVIERGEADRIWRMIHELESGEPD